MGPNNESELEALSEGSFVVGSIESEGKERNICTLPVSINSGPLTKFSAVSDHSTERFMSDEPFSRENTICLDTPGISSNDSPISVALSGATYFIVTGTKPSLNTSQDTASAESVVFKSRFVTVQIESTFTRNEFTKLSSKT